MTAAFEIPLTPEPQTFLIALGPTTYRTTFRWCGEAPCWILDIETSEGVPVLLGAAVVPGTDILHQYQHLGIPGRLEIQPQGNVRNNPEFDNLGTEHVLFFVTEDA